MTKKFNRENYGRPAAPVRMIHMGIGNFTRAHQMYYTENAPDAEEWGIAAFTGRRPDAAKALIPQDGLYTLIVRGAEGTDYKVISSLSKVHEATENDALLGYFESPELSVLTSTVTEAGYMRAPDGSLDVANADVAGDIEALRADPRAVVKTTPAKVTSGLLARRAAGSGAMTILPCDNLPGNGEAFEQVIVDCARAVDETLVPWIKENIAFATCMVDRITPATTDADREEVRRECGYEDASPVPTESFNEWVVAGEFPAGRPKWEEAGATLVDDVTPFEDRKLWMLNGSHSLMAYAATIRGFETVGEAILDPEVRGWVNEWWDVAAKHLEVPSDDYRAALLDRFENQNIRHLLAQIAADGSQKIPVRIVPALRGEIAAGRLPDGPLRAIAAWIQHLRGNGAPVKDAQTDLVAGLVGDDLDATIGNVLKFLGDDLAANADVVKRVKELALDLVPEA
ncbi:MAG TPA: mannitol dehydrogenase family protein [Actinomycetaceae bacterium]|nr:mannitol dehydrogenase family protein [Actinomycetaceae bacterium]